MLKTAPSSFSRRSGPLSLRLCRDEARLGALRLGG